MILLTFLLLVSGCIYDEYDDNTNVIRFSTKVGGIRTRGLYTSESFSNFNVTAMGSSTPYFSNLNVTKQDDGSWRTASTKYWPAYPLTFYGYAPASLQDSVVITDSLHLIKGFKLEQNVSQQTDVITAYLQANRNTAGGAAPLDFKHALAQVEVLAKNGSPVDPSASPSTAQYSVEVLGVMFGQVRSTADMTFRTSADCYPEWTNVKGSQNFIIKSTSGPLTLDQEARSIMFGSNNFLLVPHQLSAWSATHFNNGGAFISVLLRIKDQLNNLIYPSDPDKFGFAALPVSNMLQAGHKYTYTLAFFTNGGGAGVIPPILDNPQYPGDPDVDPNPGYPDKVPGDLVVPDTEIPITVTVNITDWLSGADDNINLEF